MFMLLVRHGRQKSARREPERVMRIKRMSSVDGVMGIRDEENSLEKKPGHVIYPMRPFRKHIRRTIGERVVCSCLSSNEPRGA